MKKKYMIAIAAVVVFAGVATAFAVQAGGKDDPLTPVESITSSSVSLTIGEINSAGVAGGGYRFHIWQRIGRNRSRCRR